MIEYATKNDDPHRMLNNWQSMNSLHFVKGRHDFTFTRFIYRINGVIYKQESKEFNEAVKKEAVWAGLSE